MDTGINIVDVVKYISFMMACSVLVAVWHYECHQPASNRSEGKVRTLRPFSVSLIRYLLHDDKVSDKHVTVMNETWWPYIGVT